MLRATNYAGSFENTSAQADNKLHPRKVAEAMSDAHSMQHQPDRTHAADLAEYANQNQRGLYIEQHQIARQLFLPVQQAASVAATRFVMLEGLDFCDQKLCSWLVSCPLTRGSRSGSEAAHRLF